jgi:hypothetical protein
VAILLIDPTYPENEQARDEFETSTQNDLLKLFPDLFFEDVDAGPSASIPGWIVKLGLAGWFLFTAPGAINENLPLWETNFQMARDYFEKHALSFSIDLHDAYAATLGHMAKQFCDDPDRFKLLSCVIHHANINGNWSSYHDHFEIGEPTTTMEKHSAACSQYLARYVFHIEYEFSGYTAVVEKNGEVVSVTKL